MEVGKELAYVLSGGDTDLNKEISEDQMYKLELDSFMKLIETEKTQKRIMHTLKTLFLLTALILPPSLTAAEESTVLITGSNRGIGFEFEHPVAIALLEIQQALLGRCDAALQLRPVDGEFRTGR